MARKKRDPATVEDAVGVTVDIVGGVEGIEDKLAAEVVTIDIPGKIPPLPPPTFYSEDYSLSACLECGAMTTGRMDSYGNIHAVCPEHWDAVRSVDPADATWTFKKLPGGSEEPK